MRVRPLTAEMPLALLRQAGALLHWALVALACLLARRSGAVPAHVAFIMDGNRRFAGQRGLQQAAGHRRGYSKARSAVHAPAQPRPC